MLNRIAEMLSVVTEKEMVLICVACRKVQTKIVRYFFFKFLTMLYFMFTFEYISFLCLPYSQIIAGYL